MRNFWTKGDLFILMTGAALATSMILLLGLILVLFANGFGHFLPGEVTRFELNDGRTILGEITDREEIGNFENAKVDGNAPYRIQIKRGNRDIYGMDFIWIDEAMIESRERPENVSVFERTEWGNFYGWPRELWDGDRRIAGSDDPQLYSRMQEQLDMVQEVVERIHHIEKYEIGEINHAMERVRLELKSLKSQGTDNGPKVDQLQTKMKSLDQVFQGHVKQLGDLRNGLVQRVVVTTAEGREVSLPLSKILQVYQPNDFGLFSKTGFVIRKGWELIAMDPRESNTEGGVFPALFGTIMMVFLMSLVATPLGVLAAVFLREYAHQGKVISMIRIAVNNLAGVPSIVFGVFGVGFFIYFIGGSIDQVFFSESLPTPTFGTGGILWASLTLALMTVPVVIVTTEEGLSAVTMGVREASLAVGSTKFETLRHVVLPAVAPSILTGLILAMARAAGEVAPLMITGVVKMAPSLPVDSFFPFVHLDRKFMHLGFHIYDVGFQSPNIDAAKPMVYTTTLLLLALVLMLNSLAISLRTRLRKKLRVSNL